jgi:hypothetical protein
VHLCLQAPLIGQLTRLLCPGLSDSELCTTIQRTAQAFLLSAAVSIGDLFPLVAKKAPNCRAADDPNGTAAS